MLYVNFLLFSPSNPLSKFLVVRNSGGKHDNSDSIRKLDDDFFPHVTSVSIIDIVNLIEDNVLYILQVI
jgi:hypothetical protein